MQNKQTNIMKKINLPKSVIAENIAILKTQRVISLLVSMLMTVTVIVTAISLVESWSYIVFGFMLVFIFGIIVMVTLHVAACDELKYWKKQIK